MASWQDMLKAVERASASTLSELAPCPRMLRRGRVRSASVLIGRHGYRDHKSAPVAQPERRPCR